MENESGRPERFAQLRVGDKFFFATREIEWQQPYTKIEEVKRPYTPEAFSNTQRSDGVVFYTTPTTPILLLELP